MPLIGTAVVNPVLAGVCDDCRGWQEQVLVEGAIGSAGDQGLPGIHPGQVPGIGIATGRDVVVHHVPLVPFVIVLPTLAEISRPLVDTQQPKVHPVTNPIGDRIDLPPGPL